MKNSRNDFPRRLTFVSLVVFAGCVASATGQCRAGTMAVAPYAPIAKSTEPEQVAEIELFVGESRVFPTPDVARIAVGNAQVITANALDDKDTIIFANGAGTSSLFVWNKDGRYQRIKVNVVLGDVSRVAREVATFLSTIPRATTSVVGDKVDTLSGTTGVVAGAAQQCCQLPGFAGQNDVFGFVRCGVEGHGRKLNDFAPTRIIDGPFASGHDRHTLEQGKNDLFAVLVGGEDQIDQITRFEHPGNGVDFVNHDCNGPLSMVQPGREGCWPSAQQLA